ncbi:separase isoform X1, partial [Tanacetum coccineum]
GHCIPDRMSTEKLEKLEETHGVTLDTLKHALKSHDLFLYSGHGDARQYIPGDEIRKVNASCAVCLFGCSSGYISNRRSRVPNGASLDYLLAGCPVVISNLWVVTAKSCEVLATELLGSLLKAARAILIDCSKNRETKFGATRLCTHQTDLASLFLGAREIESERIYKVDLAGTVIYGLPTRVASKTG